MKKANKYLISLQPLAGTNTLIEVDRSPMTNHKLWGFVIGANTHFLMLSIVDDSYFLSGCTIVRIDDIKGYRIVDDRGDMVRYVLSRRYPKGYLQQPKIDLTDVEDFSFLKNIHEGYPLVTVFREEIDDTVCSIGRINALKPKTFLLHAIGIDATWSDMRRLRYEDVTRIDFGGSYEEALWMYSEYLSKQEGRRK